MKRLTPNQRERLMMLARHTGAPPGRWVHDRECGGPSALWHLWDKGYVERQFRTGPRGGEYVYYRPNGFGWDEIERLRARAEKETLSAEQRVVKRLPSRSEVDTALIHARDNGLVVRVITEETEYRGVPGQVHRADDYRAKLMLPIGQREIPLDDVLRVTLG